MKVAVVNQPLDGILPPDQNSIGIWTYETTRRLESRCDVTVYGRYFRNMSERGVGRRFTMNGIKFHFLNVGPTRVWERVASITSGWLASDRPIYSSKLYYLEYALQVAWHVRRSRPDVVHIHNFTSFVPIIRVFNRDVPIVLHMSCEWLSQLDRRLMSSRIGRADRVFGTSDHITNLVKARFPEFADKCRTVFNGVDIESIDRAGRAHPEPGEGLQQSPSLLFVGRVSPEKGVHDLIDALPRIFERFPDARLDIVGSIGSLDREYIVGVSKDPLVRQLDRFYLPEAGSYLDELRRRVPAGREDQVRFVGPLSHEDVIGRYRTADCLVNPSYSESFGMTPVEAMACGVPVVATRVGGMKETLVDKETGFLVDADDPAALAEAIVSVLSDRPRRNLMGQAGRRRVTELFSWDSVASATEGQYRDVVAAATDRGPQHDRVAVSGVVGHLGRSLRSRIRTGFLRRLHRRTLPLESATLDRPAIVIAPHPDDETLGCGGLIALKRQRGVPVIIVFMTDGAASHAGEGHALGARRRHEAESAAFALGVEAHDLRFLDIADGSLDAHSGRAVEDLAAIIETQVAIHEKVQILAPHPLESPSDHSAAHSIANSAVTRLGLDAEALLYPVWLWDQWPFTNPLAAPRSRHSRRQVMAIAWRDRFGLALLGRFDHRIDVTEVLEQKRRALESHASQVAVVPDQPERLTLSDVAAGDWLDLLMQPSEFYTTARMGQKAT